MIVGEELILAIGQLDGLYLQIGGLILLHEPLERHGVPDDDAIVLSADALDGLLHIVVGHNVGGPAVFLDEVMAEATLVNDDGVVLEVLAVIDDNLLAAGGHHAMGEELNDGLAVAGVIARKTGIHTEHEVGLVLPQVGLGLESGLEPHDVGDVELLENHLQKVDVIAVGLAVLVEEHIRPEVPRIFVDEGSGLVIYHRGVLAVSGRSRGCCACQHQECHQHP